jgi:membrane-bound metal-dependent hydrolase YbcI (DUF457 family)
VDIATHALSSYALARGFFPRRRWPVIAGMILAGTFADIDLLSALFGPAAYFAAHRTYTHSFLCALLIVAVAIFFVLYLAKKQPENISSLFMPLAAASFLHIVLDLFQSEGVMLLWPFRTSRLALDWLPTIDPWVLAILIAGIFIPELFRLVTSEIGAKSKTPRGRNGAIAALVCIALYIGARAGLHSGATASLEPHSYQGESARRVAAYPDAFSIFTWHGVVETQSLLCTVSVPAGPGAKFDPEAGACLHKPDPSPELDAAQKTPIAREYLSAVPFPRALVEKTQSGYDVAIRSMRDLAEDEVRHRVAALIHVDSNFSVSSQELVWAKDVSLR